MKRYNIEEDVQRPNYNFWHSAIIEEEAADGEWVKADEAEDIEAERDQLKAENRQLRERGVDQRPANVIAYITAIEAERDQALARVAELEAEVARLKAPKPVISVETGRADE